MFRLQSSTRNTLGARLLGLFLIAVVAHGAAEPDATSGEVVTVDSLADLRRHADRSRVRVRLRPGTYTLDEAAQRHFIVISGDDSEWDLRGVRLRIDTQLFHRNIPRTRPEESFYCAISITGNRVRLTGLTTENFGDLPGLQSKNKIINITGSDAVLRDVEITTSGSSPWGHGSLYGISGGDVRKMNGIRVGWPARNVQLIGCRVHMRAMGHGIFLQGATDTRITACHVDGLLRATNEILAETSGYAFERQFRTRGHDYSEGVTLGPRGEILPNEIIALSEDGIRLYPNGGVGRPTGRTIIENCTVTRMRRGICTGLGPAADEVINCEVRECVAAGFNLGSGDTARDCRADAKYAEAICLPYVRSRGATVDVEILDSRGGLANSVVAVINGQSHQVTLRTTDPARLPAGLSIELSSWLGYAFYQRGSPPKAEGITLVNPTPATVRLHPGAVANQISSRGPVEDHSGPEGRNTVLRR